MILGIDPGATTGWCLYDPTLRRAIECGEFDGHDYGGTAFDLASHGAGHSAIESIVIERPRGYGAMARPQLIDCGYVCGRMVERLARRDSLRPREIHELTRLDVCKALTAAVHGQINVRNDSTAWAALLLLHGDDAGRKAKVKRGVEIAPAGALGIVTGHARAALAVAVAWSLRGTPCAS